MVRLLAFLFLLSSISLGLLPKLNFEFRCFGNMADGKRISGFSLQDPFKELRWKVGILLILVLKQNRKIKHCNYDDVFFYYFLNSNFLGKIINILMNHKISIICLYSYPKGQGKT